MSSAFWQLQARWDQVHICLSPVHFSISSSGIKGQNNNLAHAVISCCDDQVIFTRPTVSITQRTEAGLPPLMTSRYLERCCNTPRWTYNDISMLLETSSIFLKVLKTVKSSSPRYPLYLTNSRIASRPVPHCVFFWGGRMGENWEKSLTTFSMRLSSLEEHAGKGWQRIDFHSSQSWVCIWKLFDIKEHLCLKGGM